MNGTTDLQRFYNDTTVNQPEPQLQVEHATNEEQKSLIPRCLIRFTERQWAIYQYIDMQGKRGCTLFDIQVGLGLVGNQVSSRLAELHRMGVVVKSGALRRSKRMRSNVWVTVSAGEKKPMSNLVRIIRKEKQPHIDNPRYGTLWVHMDDEFEDEPEVHMLAESFCKFPAMISLVTGKSYNDPNVDDPGLDYFIEVSEAVVVENVAVMVENEATSVRISASDDGTNGCCGRGRCG